jgi:hypothetical protein
MPTQRRISPPRNINRFSYIEYMRPSGFSISGREPLRAFLLKQFRLILTMPERELEAAYLSFSDKPATLDFDTHGPEDPAEILPQLGMKLDLFLKNRPFYALQYLIEHDKEWDQHAEAWRVFRRLKPHEKIQLQNESQKQWHYRSRWTWNDLLTTIARDQKFFREALIDGPTKAGIVETQSHENEPLWAKHALSSGTAKRIYNVYGNQLSRLLGVGMRAPRNLQAELKRLGIVDASGRFPARPIEKILAGQSLTERNKFSGIGIHFFAHALQNLQNWRYGRKPLHWRPYDCMESCLKLQERLAVRPPSSLETP